MKKVLLVILSLLLLCGCSSKNNLKEITYNDFKEKVDSRESFLLYINRTGCSHCENYEPVLIKALNNKNVIAYKLNLANLTVSEENAVTKKVNLKGTPTLIYIKEGHSMIDTSLIGESTYENTIDFLNEYNN